MLSLHTLCWVLELDSRWVKNVGLLAPHGGIPPLHPAAPVPSLGQGC